MSKTNKHNVLFTSLMRGGGWAKILRTKKDADSFREHPTIEELKIAVAMKSLEVLEEISMFLYDIRKELKRKPIKKKGKV